MVSLDTDMGDKSIRKWKEGMTLKAGVSSWGGGGAGQLVILDQ